MKRWQRIKSNSYGWLYGIICLWIASFMLLGILDWYFKFESVVIIAILNLIIGAPVIIGVLCISRSKRSICRKVNAFIKSNDLYVHHTEYGENNKKHEVIDYYPEIYFKLEDNNIQLKIRLDGTPEAEKFRNVDVQLEGLFANPCIDSHVGKGYIIYSFDTEEQKQNSICINDSIPNLSGSIIPFSGDITWDWYKVPHFLLTGLTGSGKTMCARYIIRCLVEEGCKVYYCDPKNDFEMKLFIQKTPNAIYVSSEQEIYNTVKMIEQEMRKRQKELDNVRLESADFTPIYIVFDEMIAFSKIADKKIFSETENLLGSIVTMGRGKRTFLGIIMQRCDTRFIDGAMRENLCCKIAMGQQSETSYEMLFGEDFRKVKNTNLNIGSGLIYRSGIDTRPREFYSPYLKE